MSARSMKVEDRSPILKPKTQAPTSRARKRKTRTPKKRESSNFETTAVFSDCPVAPQQTTNICTKPPADNPTVTSDTHPPIRTRSKSRKSPNAKKIVTTDVIKSADAVLTSDPKQEEDKKESASRFKEEDLQGFVVEDWCELGPSPHTEGHSPLRQDTLAIKQSPSSVHKYDSPLRQMLARSDSNKPQEQEVNSTICKKMFNSFIPSNQTRTTSPVRAEIPGRGYQNCSITTTSAPLPFHSMWTNPSITSPFSFQLSAFSVPRESPAPPPHTWDLTRGESNKGVYSMAPNLFPMSIPNNQHSELVNRLSRAPLYPTHPATTSVPSLLPPYPSSANHDMQSLIGGFQYPGMLYPESVYPNGSLPSQGMIFLPPHPYLFHQVPYLSMIPNLNYMQIKPEHPDPVTPTDLKPSVPSLQLPQSSFTPTPDTISLKSEMKYEEPTNQQPLKFTLKPKMSGGEDFIDPTRLKFGVDDEGTDEELVKIEDNSDTSDEEWQPSKNIGKTKLDQDSGSMDEDEATRSPVKKARKKGRSMKHSVECPTCGKVFRGEYHLRRHLMSHSEIRPYQCQQCSKSFKQKAHLHGHMNVHERALKIKKGEISGSRKKSKSDTAKSPGRPRKPYTEKDLSCKECGKVFKTIYRLKRHEQSHTDVRPFLCRVCGKGFKQTGHRNEHEANHEKTKKRFLCNMCGVVFRCRSSFNNHMRTHGMEKQRLLQPRDDAGEVTQSGYDCPYCPDKFATAQALNSHLETHVEVLHRRHVQPYSCDVCKRTFTYRHNLLKHKLIHKAPEKYAQYYKEKIEAHVASGKPSYGCTLCSKVFIRKETLAKHAKLHSGNKPFKCNICNRDFSQNVHLKVHMRKHTGSRPFECNDCKKKFIDSTGLAKHIENEACNSENVMYRCQLCEKRHFYLGSIKLHIRKDHNVHSDENVERWIQSSQRVSRRKSTVDTERFKCNICLCSFTEKCNLVRHVKKKHADLVELLNTDQTTSRSLEQSDPPSACISTKYSETRSSASQSGISEKESSNSFPSSQLAEADDDSRQLMIDEHVAVDNKCPATEGIAMEEDNKHTESRALGNNFRGIEEDAHVSNASHETTRHPFDKTGAIIDDCHKEDCHDGLLQGFRKTEFNTVELCRSVCCDRLKDDGCLANPVELTSEFGYPEEKTPTEPTEGNFLYNFGLIVSAKARKREDVHYGCPGECGKDKTHGNAGDAPASTDCKECRNVRCESQCTEYRQADDCCVITELDTVKGQGRITEAYVQQLGENTTPCLSTTDNYMNQTTPTLTDRVHRLHIADGTLVDADLASNRHTSYNAHVNPFAICSNGDKSYSTLVPLTTQVISPAQSHLKLTTGQAREWTIQPSVLSLPFNNGDTVNRTSSFKSKNHHENEPGSKRNYLSNPEPQPTSSDCTLAKASNSLDARTNCTLPQALSETSNKLGGNLQSLEKTEEKIEGSSQEKPDAQHSKTEKEEYESCPTLSHLDYLGLLACKDAREIERKTYPSKTVYDTNKAWLEDLILNSKTKQRKVKVHPSKEDPTPQVNEGTVIEKVESVTIKVNLSKDAASNTNEPSIFNKKWRRRNKIPQQLKIEQEVSPRKLKTPDSTITQDDKSLSIQTDNFAKIELPNLSPLQGDLNGWALAQPILFPPTNSLLALDSTTQTPTPSSVQVLDPHQPTTTTTNIITTSPCSTSTTGTMTTTWPAQKAPPHPRPPSTAGVSPPLTPDSTTKIRNHFPCLVCAKVFSARHQLKRHEMTHTDFRPYNCDKCGRAFRQKVHLSDHIKRHQGQRPFACSGCGKRFVLKNEMNQHIKNHCRGATDALSYQHLESNDFNLEKDDSNGVKTAIVHPQSENLEGLSVFEHPYKEDLPRCVVNMNEPMAEQCDPIKPSSPCVNISHFLNQTNGMKACSERNTSDN